MRTKRTALTVLLVLALDQLSKQLWKDADAVLIPGLLKLKGSVNTGVAFSLFGASPLPLTLLTLLIVAALAAYLFIKKPGGLLHLGLSLLLAGALGNLIDRLLLGHVIDFVELMFIRFPIFNLADIAITAGFVLSAIAVLRMPEAAHG